MEKEELKESISEFEQPQRMSLFRDNTNRYDLGVLYLAIWHLAWPASLAQVVRSIAMFVIRVVVGLMGEKAFNSVSIGLQVFMVILTVIAAIAVGNTALVAQCWGAGDRARAGRVLQQSLLWGLLLSILIAVAGLPASRLIFHLMKADAETIALGSSFMRWLFLGVPLMTPGFFLASGLRAAGDTKTPMIGAFIMGVLAVVLACGLTLGKWGMPRLGVLGAALSIGGSFASFTVFLGILFILNKTVIKLPLRGWRLDYEVGISLFKIGIPSALEWILIQLGILVYVGVIYLYGDEAAAGYFMGIAILGFAHASGMGFQAASATLVGQMVGASKYDRAESAFRHSALMSFVAMIGVGIIIYLLTTPVILNLLFRGLTDESTGYARIFLTLLVFAMPLMGVSFSLAGGLRGAGDTENGRALECNSGAVQAFPSRCARMMSSGTGVSAILRAAPTLRQ
jgi:putative MATE family efflux protein